MGVTKRKLTKKRGYLRPYISGSWCPVEDSMLLSKAFCKLAPSAVVLLLHMLRIDKNLAWKNGDQYSGAFNLTYTEAERFGLARATINRAFDELKTHGFIEIVVQGGLKSRCKTSSVYRIIERWRTWEGLQKITELEALQQLGRAV